MELEVAAAFHQAIKFTGVSAQAISLSMAANTLYDRFAKPKLEAKVERGLSYQEAIRAAFLEACVERLNEANDIDALFVERTVKALQHEISCIRDDGYFQETLEPCGTQKISSPAIGYEHIHILVPGTSAPPEDLAALDALLQDAVNRQFPVQSDDITPLHKTVRQHFKHKLTEYFLAHFAASYTENTAVRDNVSGLLLVKLMQEAESDDAATTLPTNLLQDLRTMTRTLFDSLDVKNAERHEELKAYFTRFDEYFSLLILFAKEQNGQIVGEIKDVYQQIVEFRQEFRELREALGAGTNATPSLWNVPDANRYFTGREEPLKKLKDALHAGGAVAVTHQKQKHVLYGMGGVGKTQLALEYCHRCHEQKDYPDYEHIWWVNAESDASATQGLAELAKRIGRKAENNAELAQMALWWLSEQKRWLLVFDNAEDPKALETFLPKSKHGHVLVTSRTAKWGTTFQEMPLDTWSREESIEYLQERLGTDTPEEDLDTLANLLGDLPLSLAHAAAYIEDVGVTLPEYIELYRERENRIDLNEEENPLHNYDKSVKAAIMLSVEYLENKQQTEKTNSRPTR